MFQAKNHYSAGWTVVFILLSNLITQAQAPQNRTTPFRLLSKKYEATYRAHLPEVEDPEVQKLLSDERLVIYTEKEIPRAYQDWDGVLPGIHSAFFNISADQEEPFGNGNREFPWGHPAGTHLCENVRSFRFFWLPLDEQGKSRPVVWFQKKYKGDTDYGYAWIFPKGTVFGEVLQVGTQDGRFYTFELRVRKREVGDWDIDVFRPFPNPKTLAKRIKKLQKDWEQHPKLVALVGHLENKPELKVDSLASHHPDLQVFRQVNGIDCLPEIDNDELVSKLLTRSAFKSVVGSPWRDEKKSTWASAPTTNAAFHIVPAKYAAGFIESDRDSCMRCHETTGQHVREFENRRDWYGRVRGSDGIFSFHPFDKKCIGTKGVGTPVILNQQFLDAGFLAKYNPQKHVPTHYRRIRRLEH